MILIIYQAFGQIARIFYQAQKDNSFRDFVFFTEALQRQLEAFYCKAVPFEDKNAPFFFFKEGTLAFISTFSPEGPLLIIYTAHPEKEGFLAYLEVPYTGQRLPENLKDWITDQEKKLYSFKAYKFRLFGLKLDELGDEEELEKWLPGEPPPALFRLEVEGPRGEKREITFNFCSQ